MTPRQNVCFLDNSENPQTAQEFHAWQLLNSAQLAAAHDRYEREVQAIVLRALVPMLQRGYELQEAGNILLRTFNYGTTGSFTLNKRAARRALIAIGWEPSKPSKGDPA